jgi:hypothetical protein
MLCPNCGTKTTTEHKFCRNCGMNLEPVARALAAHQAHGGAAAQLAREADRRVVVRRTNGLFAGLMVVLFGLLLTALFPGKAFKFLGIASALIGIVAVLMSALSPLRPVRDGGAGPRDLDDAAPDTGRLLKEQTFEHARVSVTDHTTELLNVELKDRKPRD